MSKKISVPVEKNKEYTVGVYNLTSEGFGVGKVEGFTVFIEGALPGETVKILIVGIKSSYAYGKLIEIIEASSERVEPACPIVKRCGGCSLQHLNYDGQLNFKTQQVQGAIERIGGFCGVEVLPTIGMENPWRYRNKAQFPVGEGANIGFYANRSHTIIPTDTCVIQDEINDTVIAVVKKFILQYKIAIYNEKTGKGLVRHVVTRKGFKTNEVMVILVINGEQIPYEEALVKSLMETLPNIKSIVLNSNEKNTNVILGYKNKVIYGEETIQDYIGQYMFDISPLSFFQVNPVQTDILYGKALEYAGLTGDETVIDAYCGIGTISLFLSQKAKKVYGVEIIQSAIDNAIENANRNKVTNAEFICGESEVVIPKMYEQGIKADVIVVDPPRKGCDEKLLDAIAKMEPKRVVYVSCNPATLARDMKYLCDRGYEVGIVQPVDMFPMTPHVESVVLMSKK